MTLASALVASHDWEGAALELHQHAEAGGPEDADTLVDPGTRGSHAGAKRSGPGLAAAGSGAQGRRALPLRPGRCSPAPGEAAGSPPPASAGPGGGRVRGCPSPNADDLPARIETLSGRCMLAAGDVAGARNAFLRARVLDPYLLRPALELRKLEAGGVQ